MKVVLHKDPCGRYVTNKVQINLVELDMFRMETIDEYLSIYNIDFGQYIYRGAIMVGVHKRNVSPQNHSHNITLNDNYIYEIIFLVDSFFH